MRRRLINHILHARPPVAEVVSGATPIVAFGDIENATVASLAINPSNREFESGGLLLPDTQRRLESLASLRLTSYDDMNEEHATKIYDASNTYFRRNPFRRYFNPLGDVLEAVGDGASYRLGTATHIDLSPWATAPTFSGLSAGAKRSLITAGNTMLSVLLASPKLRLVVVNGATAHKVVGETLGLNWQSVAAVPIDGYVFSLSRADYSLVRFVSWNLYLQRCGTTKVGRKTLGAAVTTAAR